MTVAEFKDTALEYLFADHLGTPVVGTNTSRKILWRDSRTPFGEQMAPLATRDYRKVYTGHIEDSDLGLSYMQARYYDPAIGRFLSKDPVGFAGGGAAYHNRYAYTANDPVNAIDPTGKSKKRLLGLVGNQIRKAEQRAIKNARARGRRRALKEERQSLRETGESRSVLSKPRQDELLSTGKLKNMYAHHEPSISSGKNLEEKVRIAEDPKNITFKEKAEHRKINSDAGGTSVPLDAQGKVIVGALGLAAAIVDGLSSIPDPVSAILDPPAVACGTMDCAADRLGLEGKERDEFLGRTPQ